MANTIRWIIIIILAPLVPFMLIPFILLFLFFVIVLPFFILPVFIDGIGPFGLCLIVLFFVAKSFFKKAWEKIKDE